MSSRCFITVHLLLFLLTAGTFAQDLKRPQQQFINRAEGYVSSGAWNSAKREIDAGLEQFPDDADLRYLNGRYYYVVGDLKEARYNLVKAVQNNDQHQRAKRVLVDVEENLGHFTSAICYINELLEFQPYDRDLWRRKIAFYRRIGNDVEADAALERLSHIYPNDTLVVNDVKRRNHENWGNILRKNSLSEAADNLEQWIDKDPTMRDYYIELISIYIKMGESDKALGAANRALIQFPNDQELLSKAVGLMIELGLYSQALSLVKSKSPGSRIYNNLLYEIASASRIQDPYESQARLYQATHDRDALAYLLNASMTRGFFEDARFYLNESFKIYGRTFQLLAKLYSLEKKEGNDRKGIQVLTELYALYPEDEDLQETYSDLMLKLVDHDFTEQQWDDAYLHLHRVLEVLPPVSAAWPGAVTRQIMVLGHLGRYSEALTLCQQASRQSPSDRQRFVASYEEQAAVRIKMYIEQELYKDAINESQLLLEISPSSETALRTLINMSQTLKHSDQFHEYAERGYVSYPNVPYFIVKQAVSLQEQGLEANALKLLKPRHDADEYINPQLVAAHSGISQEWAAELLKQHLPEVAMQVIDTALVYDPDNQELLYCKGLAYESLKEYSNAFEYQHRYYNPGNAEQQEFMEHIRYLSYKGSTNRIDASYIHAVYDTHADTLVSTGHLYSLATVSYSRAYRHSTLTGQFSYKGIDGYHDSETDEQGGVGLEFMAQLEHQFNERWSGTAGISLSTRYFNRIGANLMASYSTAGGWTPSLRLGYRLTPPTYLYLGGSNMGRVANDEFSIYLVTPSVSKAWERAVLTADTDLSFMAGSLYYHTGLKGRFLINNDNVSSITLMTGFGTFPELTFFEQTSFQDFSHTSAMVGLDLQYLLTDRLCLGITGTWNTCYSPQRRPDGSLRDSYRNIFAIAVQAHIAF